MPFFSKGGLKVTLRALLLAALIAIRINLPAASYLDDPWAAHASLVMGFIVFALSASLAVAILSYLYRRNKKLPSSKNDNVLLGLRNIYYIVLTGAAMITTEVGVFPTAFHDPAPAGITGDVHHGGKGPADTGS